MTTATASPDVEAVVEATRHLHDFRQGYAEILYRLACMSTQFLRRDAVLSLEPAVRILGPEAAQMQADRLWRAAASVTVGWDPQIDADKAQHDLEAVCADVAHKVADEFHRDSRACLAITEGRVR